MSLVASARIRRRDGQPIGLENPRSKYIGGGCFLLMALVMVTSLTGGPAIATVLALLLGGAAVGAGVRMILANTATVEAPFLELRFPFRTRRVPLDSVEGCRPR